MPMVISAWVIADVLVGFIFRFPFVSQTQVPRAGLKKRQGNRKNSRNYKHSNIVRRQKNHP